MNHPVSSSIFAFTFFLARGLVLGGMHEFKRGSHNGRRRQRLTNRGCHSGSEVHAVFNTNKLQSAEAVLTNDTSRDGIDEHHLRVPLPAGSRIWLSFAEYP
jgi:hypothetical protein